MAYARVICNGTYKAQGVSTRDSASLMAAVVTHKMGHQLGPAHTFNGDQGNCGGDNRSATTAYEPGAGNTIMSYDSRHHRQRNRPLALPAGLAPGVYVVRSGSEARRLAVE